MDSSGNLPDLIRGFRRGEKTSIDELFEVLYPQLRQMAVSRLRREPLGHSWQPTILVNELYLELLRNRPLGGAADEEERAVFLGMSGFLMKRLLITHSRGLRKKTPHIAINNSSFGAITPGDDSLQVVEGLLLGLERVDPKLRSVVEFRVFEGLTGHEIATRLGCSPRSVGTYWNFARTWLCSQIRDAA